MCGGHVPDWALTCTRLAPVHSGRAGCTERLPPTGVASRTFCAPGWLSPHSPWALEGREIGALGGRLPPGHLSRSGLVGQVGPGDSDSQHEFWVVLIIWKAGNARLWVVTGPSVTR